MSVAEMSWPKRLWPKCPWPKCPSTADAIVMDFSKEFDKVDHQRFLLKLHRLGINTWMITWIQSFLSGRTQHVVLDGETSDACPILSGVP